MGDCESVHDPRAMPPQKMSPDTQKLVLNINVQLKDSPCVPLVPFYTSYRLNPRTLVNEMMAKVPSDLTMDKDLVPGGDLRARGNGWLRSAFVSSGLKKVPREGQVRVAVKKLAAKKKLGSLVTKKNIFLFVFASPGFGLF